MTTEEIVANMKLTVTGDGAVGKSALLLTYLKKQFPTNYIPTVIDTFMTKLSLKGGGFISLEIWDTAGQEDLENIRKLNYPNTSVALICYSCVSMASFHNVTNIWVEELRAFDPSIPFILCGTKSDLKQRYPERAVSEEEGRKLCQALKGYESVQCSAKNYDIDPAQIKLAFATAVSCHLNRLNIINGTFCASVCHLF